MLSTDASAIEGPPGRSMTRYIMLKYLPILLLLSFAALISCGDRRQTSRILIFSKTTAYRDSSLESVKMALYSIGSRNGFIVDTTEDAAYFNEDSLRHYSAVIFLFTTDRRDSLLDSHQENAFERYIQAGGSYIGIRSADAERQWGWYQRMLEGRKSSDQHSMWKGEYDGGRVCYLETPADSTLPHQKEFQNQVLGAISFAIGKAEKPDYSKAHTLKMPRDENFTKTTLKYGGFDEPVEIVILPNSDILIAQRGGEIMFYQNKDSSLMQVGFLKVYHTAKTSGSEVEEGLMGLQVDPEFQQNHFLYVFYSPADTSVNRLSRFTFNANKIDKSSEKVILQFYSQREMCCHTGGSMAFDNNNTLYLSTGDNTSPGNEDGQKYTHNGFGPLDDRPGHLKFDAARTAANSNDLRGKILRIKIRDDGGYEIPAGNLFAKGQEKTKPEIYVMGNRNPYRISVDRNTNTLYWGEVGPDAFHDSANRGPKGYDEINKTDKPGNFGWPFFTGENFGYRKYDYNNGKSGLALDAVKPVNSSRNNTGLTLLPAAKPALIYYSYDVSDKFPTFGSGGKCAMAGPLYASKENKNMPEYYNGKLFIYDWIRGWIKVVSFQPDGRLDKVESFMNETHFNSPIDMEVGPDGKLYVLEYGNGWFTKNAEAALSRIDYDPHRVISDKGGNVVRLPQKTVTDSASLKIDGHKQSGGEITIIDSGRLLIESLDCKVCHKVNEVSIGPSFSAVEKKYARKTKSMTNHLSQKIINGGTGVWGQASMPAHPTLSEANAHLIIEYIYSLSPKSK